MTLHLYLRSCFNYLGRRTESVHFILAIALHFSECLGPVVDVGHRRKADSSGSLNGVHTVLLNLVSGPAVGNRFSFSLVWVKYSQISVPCTVILAVEFHFDYSSLWKLMES